MLSVIDANLTNGQLQNLIDTLEMISNLVKEDEHSDFEIKGLNLNGNYELTDVSLRSLVDFVKKNKAIKVLSIERFKVSHSSLNALFQVIP